MRVAWLVLNITVKKLFLMERSYLVLFTLSIVVTCRPTGIHDHVFFALLTRHFIILLLLFFVQRMPLKISDLVNDTF